MTSPSIPWRAVGTQGLAGALIGFFEVLLEPSDSAPAVVLLGALGLGLSVGVAAGTVMAGVLALLGRAPRVMRWALLLYAIAVGVILSDYMGILAALGGHARTLAWTALFVTTLGWMAIGALLMLLAPSPVHPRGHMAPRARVLLGPLLLVGVALLIGVRHWVPLYYEAVENVGACVGALLLGVALQMALGNRPLSLRLRGFSVLAGAALVSTALIALARPSDAVLVALNGAELPRVGLAALRRATDVDRDGHSALLGGGDCAPWNARVHPGAREIPGNGIDDNCRFGDAPNPRAAAPARPAVAPLSPSTVSVVLLTIDTLRQDRVGARPSGPSLTPNLDAWASTARAFDRAYAASTRTCSSVAALQYGAFPFELGWAESRSSRAVRQIAERLPNAMLHVPWMCVRDEGAVPRRQPLAALLRERGMATAAVVDDSLTFLLQRELFGEGFEQYHDEGHLTDEPVIARAISVLDALARGARPFFLWIHVFGPHEREAPERERDVAAEYDAEVRRTDLALAPLFQVMDGVARRIPLAAIVASDHGELFGPRRRWHGTDLSEELLRVPLLIRAPGVPPGRSAVLASTVDVLPTCLALTGTPLPGGLVGTNLAADERALPRGRTLISDVWNHSVGYSLTAAYDGRHKLVYDHLLGTYALLSQEAAPGPAASERGLRSTLDTYLHDNEIRFSD